MPEIGTVLFVLAVTVILAVFFLILILLAVAALAGGFGMLVIKYFSVDDSTMSYRHQVAQEQESKKEIMAALQRQIDSPT